MVGNTGVALVFSDNRSVPAPLGEVLFKLEKLWPVVVPRSSVPPVLMVTLLTEILSLMMLTVAPFRMKTLSPGMGLRLPTNVEPVLSVVQLVASLQSQPPVQ